MSAPTPVTAKTFQKDVLESDIPVVVDFWAPWCAPCRMIGPVLDQLAGQYDGKVKVVKCNVDDEPELAGMFRVTGIPTVLGLKSGRVEQTQVGFRGPQALNQMFEDLTGSVRVTF